MIDRLCGKTNKKMREEFVIYVDFVFYSVIKEVNKSNVENLKQKRHSFSLKNSF